MFPTIIKFLILPLVLTAPLCKEGENNCQKCNPITNICFKCISDVLLPNEDGGCSGINHCTLGKNYCQDCSEDSTLCKTCFTDDGLFPDMNGGCSYIKNCKISTHGRCLECKSNYILIGPADSYRICKSIDSEDFMNCESINYETGKCAKCEEGFFLNSGDGRCSEIEFCSQSIYAQCVECSLGFVLDNNSKEKCRSMVDVMEENPKLVYCIETDDGKTCKKCMENFYPDAEGVCVFTNNCEKTENGTCIKCQEGFYLMEESGICLNDENCLNGDMELGICSECKKGFYIDLNDRM